ncbi:MAG TPA: hypothetical protein PKE55_06180 [Kiritimatiellia bacterium]|nr:hypothetical protein [Kiritimatiellia bacterium]
MIDLQPFQKAIESLRDGLKRAAEVPQDELVRDGVIRWQELELRNHD